MKTDLPTLPARGRFDGDLHAVLDYDPDSRRPFRVVVKQWRALDNVGGGAWTTWVNTFGYDYSYVGLCTEKDFRSLSRAVRHLFKTRAAAEFCRLSVEIGDRARERYESRRAVIA